MPERVQRRASWDHRTRAIWLGECERCHQVLEGDHAVRDATRHYLRCGGTIHLERTVAFVWTARERRTSGDA